MLVGATQRPGHTYAQMLSNRSAAGVETALAQMPLEARQRGEVHTAHSDKEAGLQAAEGALLNVGARMHTTQGYDPQSNGVAENAIGRLSRMARAVLHEYSPPATRVLWPHAMVWSAQKLSTPKAPPFGGLAYAAMRPRQH